jgi:hypothetical protein
MHFFEGDRKGIKGTALKEAGFFTRCNLSYGRTVCRAEELLGEFRKTR